MAAMMLAGMDISMAIFDLVTYFTDNDHAEVMAKLDDLGSEIM